MYTINRYDVPVYNYNLFDAHKYSEYIDTHGI